MRLDRRTKIIGIILVSCCILKIGCMLIADNGVKTKITSSKVTQEDIDVAISKINTDTRTSNFTQDQKDKLLQEYINNLEKMR